MYRRNGQQVLCDDKHFADARDVEAAHLIVEALNMLARNNYEPDLFDSFEMIKPVPHLIARQNDEYACSCGVRWSVDEGENHP